MRKAADRAFRSRAPGAVLYCVTHKVGGLAPWNPAPPEPSSCVTHKDDALAQLSPARVVATYGVMRMEDPAARWNQDPAAHTCREMLRVVGQGRLSLAPEARGLSAMRKVGALGASSPADRDLQ